MNKVRLGIIGVGRQGGTYTSLITGVNTREDMHKSDITFDQIEVGALCDIDPNVRKKLQKLFPNIPVYENYLDLLESKNVDAIVTTVPHYLHPQIGIDALNRGIHTLLEKPAGVYTKQVKEVIEVAKSKPELTFGVFFNQRMNPLYQQLKKIISNGEIGDLRRVTWTITTWYRPQAYFDTAAWRATWKEEGGGVLVNQAPHQIDLLQWLCGMPKTVYANIKYGYMRDISVDDDVTVLLDYGNGATGVFITCTHDLYGTDRLEIVGDKGKIIVEGSSNAQIIRYNKAEQEVNANVKDQATVYKLMKGGAMQGNEYAQTETIQSNSKWGLQHSEILKNFAANILDKTPLVAPGSDGINGVRLVNAIYLSSWLGKEVSTDFDEDLFLEKLQEQIDKEGL